MTTFNYKNRVPSDYSPRNYGNRWERTREDIQEILDQAKLSADVVYPTSQVIRFKQDHLYDHNYKLLELDSHLLQKLNEGDTLYIKGSPDENVVICSDRHTYDVSETETSNSLLLVDNLKFKDDIGNSEECISNVEVCAVFYNYLEPIIGRPYLQKLTQILNKTVFKGPEYESEIDPNCLFTYEELLKCIQASKIEFDDALESLHVFPYENKLRILDFDYRFRILSYMLKLIDENSWQLDEIDYNETINALENLVPTVILDALFNMYTEKSKMIDCLQLYRYKELEVCKFFAEVLLSHAGKFNFTDFFRAWCESVPEGMEPKEEMLYGIAVVDKTSVPHVVRIFPEDKLPENINERFKILFAVKQKWIVPEIAPYIERMTTDKMDVSALLAKYARSSTTDGVKYYSAKHSK